MITSIYRSTVISDHRHQRRSGRWVALSAVPRALLLALGCVLLLNAGAQVTGPTDRVDSLLNASWTLRTTDPHAALRLAREGVTLAKRTGNAQGEARVLQCMAGAHQVLGQLDSAIQELSSALVISERINFLKGVVSSSQKLATLYTDRGEVKQALEHLERAELVAERMGDAEEQARTLNLKGAALMTAGRYQEAVAPYFASIVLRKRIASPSLGKSYENLGALYLNMGRTEDAGKLYEEMVAEARDRKDAILLASGFLDLSAVRSKEKRFAEVVAYADSALALFRANGNAQRAADAFLNRAMALMELGRLVEAGTDLDAAMAGYHSTGDQKGITSVRVDRAYLYVRQGKAAEALEQCDQALVLSRQNGLARLRAQVLSIRADALRALGRYDEALTVLKQYLVLKDSILGEKATEQLASAEMREKYDAEGRIAQVEQLKLAKEQEQALRKRRTTQRNALFLAVAGLLMLSFLLYRNVQHRRKLAVQAQQLHEQRINDLMHDNEVQVLNAMLSGQDTERERVAKDLHDRLGSMLSAIKLQFGSLESRLEAMHAEQDKQYRKVNVLLDDAVDEVRRISHDMVQGSLNDFGLAQALEDLRNSLVVKGRLEVEMELFGLDRRMERSVEITVYRIVQELVSNALKHGRPSEITIAVTRRSDGLSIIVSDNGKGFDPASGRDGMGLDNVRSRATALGGTLHIDSTLGHGTTVSIELPLAE